jgi:uncharacterized protein
MRVARPERRGDKGTSERTCIVTRAKAMPQDMIRFVVGPNAAIVPDIRRRLPGRGVWVLGCADIVAQAVERQAFSRGFKMKVRASPDLTVEIETELRRDCLQALSIANKAAQVVTGFVNVEKAIASGAISALVHAADCSADGVRKLGQCLRRRFGDGGAKPSISLFRSGELDLALGLTNVTHAALAEGAASEGFLDRCRRFELYRSGSSRAKGETGVVWPVENVGLNSERPPGDAETGRAGTQDA